jgi:hypothetical protein
MSENKKFEHPVLGPFEGELWEWQALRPMTLGCTGHSTANISIEVPESAERPSDAQFQQIIDVIEAPPSFRDEIAAAIFQAYSEEIRPEYLRIIAEIPDVSLTAEQVPELRTADDVWSLITGLYYLWINEDAAVNVDFSVSFDEEHQLHVRVKDRAIERVWME